ncbi:hypothetical protein A9P82_00985 [Arachidicoccus ginsenosidimutans]|nr:hypothetical protein A9P82_00985 [Arachidicoccus sp. BS20]
MFLRLNKRKVKNEKSVSQIINNLLSKKHCYLLLLWRKPCQDGEHDNAAAQAWCKQIMPCAHTKGAG